MSAAEAVPVAAVDVTLHHVRRALDELSRVPDQDSVFDIQRGLLTALTALLRMQHGVSQ